MTAEEEKPEGQMMEDVTGAFASQRKVAGTQEFKMQLDQIGIESGLYPDQAMKQTSAILELLQRGNVASQPDSSPASAVVADVMCRCPACKSEKIDDISPRADNGIIGPGYSSWKLSDIRACQECGIVFKPVKGNGI